MRYRIVPWALLSGVVKVYQTAFSEPSASSDGDSYSLVPGNSVRHVLTATPSNWTA
ncbi:MAG: hypothetical protein GXP62_11460 [Oligoflexia bacterium]|nr:hypothetical protein [Oligoflexia bacterium]